MRMAQAQTHSAALVGEAVVADTLDNLIRQFSQELCFYRELIQNAIDAGSHDIEVQVEYNRERHMAVAHVIDSGEGMDRHIIDTQLTRLFSSSKEDDYTKIGKFGIGFVSVFAVQPAAVVVDTGRSGEYWRILFTSKGEFERIKRDEPIDGTHIQVYVPMEESAFADFLADSEHTVRYWCRHSRANITFNRKQVNETFTVVSPVTCDFAEPGTSIVAGVSAAPAPPFGFYNQGLTLLEGEKQYLNGVTFKIDSRYLEHTLTRDNVKTDQNYEKAMKLLAKVVDSTLDPAMYRALENAARQDSAALSMLVERCRPRVALTWRTTGRKATFLRALHRTEPVSLADVEASARRYRALLRKIKGAEQKDVALYDHTETPATKALHEAGIIVLDHGVVSLADEMAHAVGLHLYRTEKCVAAPQVLDDKDVSEAMRAFASAVQRMLKAVGLRFNAVEFARFDYEGSPITPYPFLVRRVQHGLVPAQWHAALGEDEAPPSWTMEWLTAKRGTVLLNTAHALSSRLLRLQERDAATAAYLMAKVVCLADGVHAETEERLLAGFLKETQAAARADT
jgi:hypothetical protein